MTEIAPLNDFDIKSKIHHIRDKPVMLDRDLAILYGVKSIRLREQVKRNKERFPKDFMFQLTDNEIDFMVSQNAIPSKQHLGGSKPYVFTEQGVYMLATVLKSTVAIDVTISIMRTFTEMKTFLQNNILNIQRFERIEQRLAVQDNSINQLFKALESKPSIQEQGIFYNGQIFDAHQFVSDLIRKAKHTIILIDNYIDDNTLTLFHKNQTVSVTIYTQSISKSLQLDIDKYNQQYNNLSVKISKKFHDRFLIIDDKTYLIGASLKDLGKKVFGFALIKEINLTLA